MAGSRPRSADRHGLGRLQASQAGSSKAGAASRDVTAYGGGICSARLRHPRGGGGAEQRAGHEKLLRVCRQRRLNKGPGGRLASRKSAAAGGESVPCPAEPQAREHCPGRRTCDAGSRPGPLAGLMSGLGSRPGPPRPGCAPLPSSVQHEHFEGREGRTTSRALFCLYAPAGTRHAGMRPEEPGPGLVSRARASCRGAGLVAYLRPGDAARSGQERPACGSATWMERSWGRASPRRTRTRCQINM